MKSLLILALIPCLAHANCQAIYESLYESPELYDYADFETVESCAAEQSCVIHAIAAGVPAECLVDEREERQYLNEQFCEREFDDLNREQIEALEQCSTDAECQDMALKLGISPECAQ